MQPGKKHCIVWGVCYSAELVYLLRLSEAFQRDYTVGLYLATGGDMRTDFNITSGEFARASVVVYHPWTWTGWAQEDVYRSLVGQIPPDATRITFPHPVFSPPWPNHTLDPQFHVLTGSGPYEENNKQLLAYSDAEVLALRKRGLSPTEIVNAYSRTDVAASVDLDRLLEYALDTISAKEVETDVKVVDFIGDRFRDRRLFLCVNHGANALLIHMADQILAKLGYPPLPRYAHDSLCELMPPEIPVHPSVARYFGLKWVTPGLRYKVDRRYLTWEEYIYQIAVAREDKDRMYATPEHVSKQGVVRQWVRAVQDRLQDADLGWKDIVELAQAHSDAFPGQPIPPEIETRGLHLALAEFPQREDLRRRLAHLQGQSASSLARVP